MPDRSVSVDRPVTPTLGWLQASVHLWCRVVSPVRITLHLLPASASRDLSLANRHGTLMESHEAEPTRPSVHSARSAYLAEGRAAWENRGFLPRTNTCVPYLVMVSHAKQATLGIVRTMRSNDVSIAKAGTHSLRVYLRPPSFLPVGRGRVPLA
ncbi:hypothetical protein VTG60DRAFT_3339 [Thermothelomyces hinnuleus]